MITNWRSSVTIILGTYINYTVRHHSSCVQITSDTRSYRREKDKIVDRLERNDDAAFTMFLSGQKVRRYLRLGCLKMKSSVVSHVVCFQSLELLQNEINKKYTRFFFFYQCYFIDILIDY
jgi:hypothetical protein